MRLDSRRSPPGSSTILFTRISSPFGKKTDATYSSNLTQRSFCSGTTQTVGHRR
ncbi:hypothetical protein M8494_05695 [Serratia ureilytica]